MASEWFYRQGTEQVGPISGKEVRSLAKAGVIAPETLVRRSEDVKWIKASRITGLFGQPNSSQANAESECHDGEEPNPFAAQASRAVSSVASAAGSAASAISGVVSGWLARRDGRKLELSKESDPSLPKSTQDAAGWLDALTRDNQPAELVIKVAETVTGILMSDEQLMYVAVQSKPIVNWTPDCIALTNKRFIFYRPKLLGRVDFEDYIWRELRDAQLSENIVGSTIRIKTAAGHLLTLDYLPKSQARAVYRIAQEMEERTNEERRNRSLEEKRASAGGGIVVQTNLGVQSPAPPPAPPDSNDPMQILKKLKSMMDAGLISTADYEAKKAEVLKRI